MGFPQYTNSTTFTNPLYSRTSSLANSPQSPPPYDDIKLKTLIQKMIWELGFSCILPNNLKRHSLSKDEGEGEDGRLKNYDDEHNKAWLLAGPELTYAEPQSTHSSFRFSFCSQVEVESMSVDNSCSATVLMVNLDNGFIKSRAKQLKWSRITSLERSIFPVAHTLVRFSYSEIVSATHNFSKGTCFF